MMKNQLSLLIVGLAIAVCMVACQPTPVIVKETVLPPPPSPTPIACTQNPAGLVLDVRSLGDRRVQVIGQGFEPGEQLLLVFTTQTETRSTRLESRPVQGVNADGTFSIEETLPLPTDNTTWNLAVVHARGAACTTIMSRQAAIETALKIALAPLQNLTTTT